MLSAVQTNTQIYNIEKCKVSLYNQGIKTMLTVGMYGSDIVT